MIRTLVLGASPKEDRASYDAVMKLRRHGHPVFAVGLSKGKVGDVEINDEISGIPGFRPETITLYLGKARQESFQELILNSGANRVIFNPGAENPELASILTSKGIEAIEACTLTMLAVGMY